MAHRFFSRFLAVTVPTRDHVPDRELLQRYARERDVAAFELLLHRHARTVWTVCRRILAVEADAEDAFQATFLVLVRKAGAVRGACAGAWLHRVAVNAALRVRQRGSRLVPATAEYLDTLPASVTDDSAADSAAMVQEELARLPERYRLPVILCELEGLSHAEAARELGWPIGSVSGRLSRARDLLRKRLSLRGATAPAAIAPVASVPATLVRDTTAVAAGVTPVSPAVSTLTDGVLTMMRVAQVKIMAVCLTAVGLVAVAGFGTMTAFGQRDAIAVTSAPRDIVASVAQINGSGGSRKTRRDEDPAAEEVKVAEELKKLQGQWRVVDLEEAGRKATPEQFQDMTWTFTGAKLRVVHPAKVKVKDEPPEAKVKVKDKLREAFDDGLDRVYNIVLDPAKSPRRIDLVSTEKWLVLNEIRETDVESRLLGVYTLEHGRLMVCLADRDVKYRPVALNSTADNALLLYTLEPVKADEEDAVARELKKLQGMWRVVGLEHDGRKATPDDVKGMSWTFEGNRITGKDPDEEPKMIGEFTVNPKESPKQIDIVKVEGAKKEKTLLGIYKLEGERLTICLRDEKATDKGRPTEFSAEKGSELGIFMLEKEDPKKDPAAKNDKRTTLTLQDLRKIEPPGGVPLDFGRPGEEIKVEGLKKATKRLESAPLEKLDQWVAELERLTDKKLDTDLEKQACRTYVVVHLTVAFDNLEWNARKAGKLFDRAPTMSVSESKAWMDVFEPLMRSETLKTKQIYGIPLVLIPVDALFEAQKYSNERGQKYRARLKQLTAEDISLWRDQVDQFGGTELAAAVTIILVDAFFDKEKFQRDTFRNVIDGTKK